MELKMDQQLFFSWCIN